MQEPRLKRASPPTLSINSLVLPPQSFIHLPPESHKKLCPVRHFAKWRCCHLRNHYAAVSGCEVPRGFQAICRPYRNQDRRAPPYADVFLLGQYQKLAFRVPNLPITAHEHTTSSRRFSASCGILHDADRLSERFSAWLAFLALQVE